MASDRGQDRYSDFVALETLRLRKLFFESLLSSWRRFHVFESSHPSFRRTVFLGAPLFSSWRRYGLMSFGSSFSRLRCILESGIKVNFSRLCCTSLAYKVEFDWFLQLLGDIKWSELWFAFSNPKICQFIVADGVFHKLKLILSRFVVCRTLSKNRKELEVKLLKKRKEVVNVGGWGVKENCLTSTLEVKVSKRIVWRGEGEREFSSGWVCLQATQT